MSIIYQILLTNVFFFIQKSVHFDFDSGSVARFFPPVSTEPIENISVIPIVKPVTLRYGSCHQRSKSGE